MTDEFTADAPSVVNPYDFGKATFVPFQHLKFCIKLMIASFLIMIIPYAIYMFYLNSIGMLFNMSGDLPPASYWIATTLFYLLLWPLIASYMTAFYKRVTTGYEGGWFPLRFGARELRVMAVQLLWLVSMILFTLVFFLIIGLLSAAIGAASGNTNGAGMGLIILVVAIGYFGYFIASMYFSGRLSAASPLTAMRNKFTFWETFKATRKRGWWIVLSYFVQSLIFMVGYFIFFAIIFAILGISFIDSTTGEFNEAALTNAFSSPVMIIVGIIGYFIMSMVIGILYLMFPGVGAYVAKEYEGGTDLERISALYD